MAEALDQKTALLRSSLERLRRNQTFSKLLETCARRRQQLYLVGGHIRDTLLTKPSNDVDLVASRSYDLAAFMADSYGCRPVRIDRRFGTLRLLPPPASPKFESPIKIDLSPLRGKSIKDDLYQRDFTINALAIDLTTWEHSRRLQLIDPLGGLGDLQGGCLRACSERSLADDPLRILRAYRLLASYGLSLEPQTEQWIAESRGAISRVALERVRDELLLILTAPGAAAIVRKLDEDDLLELILPECSPMRGIGQNGFHHQDVWYHSLEALEALEALLLRPQDLLGSEGREALAVLHQQVAAQSTRKTLLKFAVLIHDIGKPFCLTQDHKGIIHFYGHEVVGARLAASLCSRLRFSNKESSFVSQLVRQHMRPLQLFNLGQPSLRAVSRFFKLGSELFWPLLFMFAADYQATLGRNLQMLSQQVGHWLHLYRQQFQAKEKETPLVSGHDLMDHLGLPPGPILGKLLKALADLQWEGRIATRQQALDLASELLKEWGHTSEAPGNPC